MLKEFETGDQIGEYTVLDKIAEGGMGIILKAQHRLMKRVVAIKISKLTAKNDELMSKMFRREIEASSHLSHPNVLTVFDAGMAGAQPYLVMEYCLRAICRVASIAKAPAPFRMSSTS